ncbi:MAG: cache domain-containing protein [Candidatus Woesearchaeota archaeon]|nr:cache domain-containing protein [Candidatus Woesearchaeota archaeon]
MEEKIEMIGIKAVKIILCFAVFLLIVTALFNYFSYSLVKERLMESYAELRENEIKELSFSISQAIDEPILAMSRRGMVYDIDKCDKELNLSLRTLKYGMNGVVDDVIYINEKGMAEVVIPYSENKLDLNYSNEPFFMELKNGEIRFIRDYVNNGSIKLIIAVPVLLAKECNPNGSNFKGVIVSTLDMSNIFDLVLGHFNSEKTPDYVAVLNSEGNILYHINNDYIGKSYSEVVDKAVYPAAWDVINKSLEGGEGYGVYAFYSHKKGIYEQQQNVTKIMAYGPMSIKDLRWTMQIILPLNELVDYSGVSYILYLTLFNLFIVLIIIISFVILLTTGLSHYKRHYKIDYAGHQRKRR